MTNKQTPIDWLMEQITYDDGGGRRLASWIETVDLKPYFDKAQQMYYSDIQDVFNEGWCRAQEMVTKIANEQMGFLNQNDHAIIKQMVEDDIEE